MLTILGLTLLIWAVMWCAFAAQAFEREPDEFFYRITKENTFDFKGIQFFHLKSAEGTATISVDGDVKLADALKALDGQRVRLTLEPATLVLKKVER